MQALWLPVWQARKIVAACRELSKQAAALVDAEIAAVVAGLPWSRILTRLAAAIMQADPALAEKKRQQAKQARYVQLCRSEDGINTMIVRADAGDLIMVYALVDRLADILMLEGSTEPADERRATAFGLLAQPAMILEMLLRHASDGTRQPSSLRTRHRRRRHRSRQRAADDPTVSRIRASTKTDPRQAICDQARLDDATPATAAATARSERGTTGLDRRRLRRTTPTQHRSTTPTSPTTGNNA